MAGVDMYQANILEHYKRPRNRGKLEPCTVRAEEENPLCGDRITIYLNHDGHTVEKAMFEGQGCAISQASASMLTEELEGKSVEHARGLGKDDVLRMLGIPVSPVRMKCALLGLSTVQAGLAKTGKDTG